MLRRLISFILIVTFTLTSVVTPSSAQTLPALPGGPSVVSPQSSTLTDLNPTAVFNGIKIYPQEPFRFDFMMSDLSLRATEGSEAIQGKINSDEIASSLSAPRNDTEILRLVKYFMASLTVPEGDLWVNLSPVEPDRIVPHALGQTEMGRDLLAQDYILKQLTASLMSPEGEAGKKFWERVYEKIYEQDFPSPLWGGQGRGNSSAEHPHPASPIKGEESSVDDLIESFNKVWIVPNEVEVYQNGDVAYITKATLKVMLEEDYLSSVIARSEATKQSQKDEIASQKALAMTEETKNIIRSTIIPLIENEVNNGESFANLRQIFHSMILAKWYEQHFKNSILGQSYVDRNVTEGIELSDAMEGTRLPVIARSASDEAIPDNMNSDEIASASALAMTDKNDALRTTDNAPDTTNPAPRTPNNASIQDIYNQYLEAFKSGAADIIKEDYDPVTQTVIPRKYFTGGFNGQMAVSDAAMVASLPESVSRISVELVTLKSESEGLTIIDTPNPYRSFTTDRRSQTQDSAMLFLEKRPLDVAKYFPGMTQIPRRIVGIFDSHRTLREGVELDAEHLQVLQTFLDDQDHVLVINTGDNIEIVKQTYKALIENPAYSERIFFSVDIDYHRYVAKNGELEQLPIENRKEWTLDVKVDYLRQATEFFYDELLKVKDVVALSEEDIVEARTKKMRELDDISRSQEAWDERILYRSDKSRQFKLLPDDLLGGGAFLYSYGDKVTVDLYEDLINLDGHTRLTKNIAERFLSAVDGNGKDYYMSFGESYVDVTASNKHVAAVDLLNDHILPMFGEDDEALVVPMGDSGNDKLMLELKKSDLKDTFRNRRIAILPVFLSDDSKYQRDLPPDAVIAGKNLDGSLRVLRWLEQIARLKGQPMDQLPSLEIFQWVRHLSQTTVTLQDLLDGWNTVPVNTIILADSTGTLLPSYEKPIDPQVLAKLSSFLGLERKGNHLLVSTGDDYKKVWRNYRNLLTAEAVNPDDISFVTDINNRRSWYKGQELQEFVRDNWPPKIRFEIGRRLIELFFNELIDRKHGDHEFLPQITQNDIVTQRERALAIFDSKGLAQFSDQPGVRYDFKLYESTSPLHEALGEVLIYDVGGKVTLDMLDPRIKDRMPDFASKVLGQFLKNYGQSAQGGYLIDGGTRFFTSAGESYVDVTASTKEEGVYELLREVIFPKVKEGEKTVIFVLGDSGNDLPMLRMKIESIRKILEEKNLNPDDFVILPFFLNEQEKYQNLAAGLMISGQQITGTLNVLEMALWIDQHKGERFSDQVQVPSITVKQWSDSAMLGKPDISSDSGSVSPRYHADRMGESIIGFLVTAFTYYIFYSFIINVVAPYVTPGWQKTLLLYLFTFMIADAAVRVVLNGLVGQPPYYDPRKSPVANAEEWKNFVDRESFIAAVIVAPLYEEPIFTWLMYTVMMEHVTPGHEAYVMAMCSLFFSLGHMAGDILSSRSIAEKNPLYFLFNIFIGQIDRFAYSTSAYLLYAYTHNLLFTIVIHALHNVLANSNIQNVRDMGPEEARREATAYLLNMSAITTLAVATYFYALHIPVLALFLAEGMFLSSLLYNGHGMLTRFLSLLTIVFLGAYFFGYWATASVPGWVGSMFFASAFSAITALLFAHREKSVSRASSSLLGGLVGGGIGWFFDYYLLGNHSEFTIYIAGVIIGLLTGGLFKADEPEDQAMLAESRLVDQVVSFPIDRISAFSFDWDGTGFDVQNNTLMRYWQDVGGQMISRIWGGARDEEIYRFIADIPPGTPDYYVFQMALDYRNVHRMALPDVMQNVFWEVSRMIRLLYPEWSRNPERYLIPGFQDRLQELNRLGKPAYIVSHNQMIRQNNVLGAFGLENRFIKQYAPKATYAPVEKAQILHRIQQLHPDGNVVHFGDTDVDRLAAQMAGVEFVAVANTPAMRQHFEEMGVRYILSVETGFFKGLVFDRAMMEATTDNLTVDRGKVVARLVPALLLAVFMAYRSIWEQKVYFDFVKKSLLWNIDHYYLDDFLFVPGIYAAINALFLLSMVRKNEIDRHEFEQLKGFEAVFYYLIFLIGIVLILGEFTQKNTPFHSWESNQENFFGWGDVIVGILANVFLRQWRKGFKFTNAVSDRAALKDLGKDDAMMGAMVKESPFVKVAPVLLADPRKSLLLVDHPAERPPFLLGTTVLSEASPLWKKGESNQVFVYAREERGGEQNNTYELFLSFSLEEIVGDVLGKSFNNRSLGVTMKRSVNRWDIEWFFPVGNKNFSDFFDYSGAGIAQMVIQYLVRALSGEDVTIKTNYPVIRQFIQFFYSSPDLFDDFFIEGISLNNYFSNEKNFFNSDVNGEFSVVSKTETPVWLGFSSFGDNQYVVSKSSDVFSKGEHVSISLRNGEVIGDQGTRTRIIGSEKDFNVMFHLRPSEIISTQSPGGIDLNAMNVKTTGKAEPMRFNAPATGSVQPLKSLVPRIIHIDPRVDTRAFLHLDSAHSAPSADDQAPPRPAQAFIKEEALDVSAL